LEKIMNSAPEDLVSEQDKNAADFVKRAMDLRLVEGNKYVSRSAAEAEALKAEAARAAGVQPIGGPGEGQPEAEATKEPIMLEDHVYAVFAGFDKDGDGQLKGAEYERLQEYLKAEAAHIKSIDTDGDGKFSEEELRKVLGPGSTVERGNAENRALYVYKSVVAQGIKADTPYTGSEGAVRAAKGRREYERKQLEKQAGAEPIEAPEEEPEAAETPADEGKGLARIVAEIVLDEVEGKKVISEDDYATLIKINDDGDGKLTGEEYRNLQEEFIATRSIYFLNRYGIDILNVSEADIQKIKDVSPNEDGAKVEIDNLYKTLRALNIEEGVEYISYPTVAIGDIAGPGEAQPEVAGPGMPQPEEAQPTQPDKAPLILDDDIHAFLSQEFDDGDGKLVGAEYSAWQKYRNSNLEYFLKKYDINKDGKIMGKEITGDPVRDIKGMTKEDTHKWLNLAKYLEVEIEEGQEFISRSEASRRAEAKRAQEAERLRIQRELNTPKELADVFYDIFKGIDSDGNGKLAEEGIQKFYETLKAKKAELIDKYDSDGDGKLSKDEKTNMSESEFEAFHSPVSLVAGQKYESASMAEEKRQRAEEVREADLNKPEITQSAGAGGEFTAGEGFNSVHAHVGYNLTSTVAGNSKEFNFGYDFYKTTEETSSDSSQMGVPQGGGLVSDISEETETEDTDMQSRLKLDADFPHGIEATVTAWSREVTNHLETSNYEHTTGPFTDVSVTVDTNQDTTENGSGYGVAVTGTVEKGGNKYKFGGIAKHAEVDIETIDSAVITTIIGGVPNVTTTGGSFTSNVDYSSFGPRFSVSGTYGNNLRFNVGVDAVWNTGKDVPSGEGFELTAYDFTEFDKVLLSVLYRLQGGKSSGQATVLWNTGNNFQGEAVENAASSLEKTADDFTFFGSQPLTLKRNRDAQTAAGSNSWLFQIGGGEQGEGLLEVKVGKDFTGSYADKSFFLALGSESSSLGDIIDFMACYNLQKEINSKDFSFSVGGHIVRVDGEDQDPEVAGGLSGSVTVKF
ncbi:hypothetical protein KY360_05290, partial [Candidatus Woesearchaeota archaeon]|nr:hypothetical protein [Candidatus Woesearchaeota archaeon]